MDQRVARLRQLAEIAGPVSAAAVLNQATLVASDAGLPDLAREWCHRQAAACPPSPAASERPDRRPVEPLVNLARLRARAGDGVSAHALLRALHQAASSGTGVEVDGRFMPGAPLRPLERWLGTVLVSDGVRALGAAGRWPEALAELERLDLADLPAWWQLTVAARLATGGADLALDLLDATAPAGPWQRAVHSCLTALARRRAGLPAGEQLRAMLDEYRELEPIAQLAHFQTRLGLTVRDALELDGDASEPDTKGDLLAGLVRDAIAFDDAYSARDLRDAGATEPKLADMVRAAGLGGGEVPDDLHVTVDIALHRLAAGD